PSSAPGFRGMSTCRVGACGSLAWGSMLLSTGGEASDNDGSAVGVWTCAEAAWTSVIALHARSSRFAIRCSRAVPRAR
ncbi:MAG: hypothetical protein ACO38P_12070, partial [Phycisphaerales bacterium]